MKAAAIILSGGKSSRMGTNKSLLRINNRRNIEIIRDSLKVLFDDVILVTNDPKAYEFLGIRMVPDEYPGMGPLAGLHAGLAASKVELNLVAACDMPFVSAGLADMMLRHCRTAAADAVVPVAGGRAHPLFAVYKKDLACEAAKCIKDNKLSMKHLLDRINVKYIAEDEFAGFSQKEIERCFFNMNHPQDYQKAKKWAAED